MKEYYKRTNAVNPMACENNFYTMKGLVYTSDGTDYTELVRQEMGLPEANGKPWSVWMQKKQPLTNSRQSRS